MEELWIGPLSDRGGESRAVTRRAERWYLGPPDATFGGTQKLKITRILNFLKKIIYIYMYKI